MSNPIAAYMASERIGTVELAARLNVSRGYASLLKDGVRPISPRIAKALAALTGEPWWKYMPDDAAEEAAQ